MAVKSADGSHHIQDRRVGSGFYPSGGCRRHTVVPHDRARWISSWGLRQTTVDAKRL